MKDLTINPGQNKSLAPSLDLLSKLWLYEVDEATVCRLHAQNVAELFESLGGRLPADDHQETLERLAVDYCQLLVGPKGHVSPVQSVWQQDQFQGESASSMCQFIELLPDYQPPGPIVDHVGVQLDFASKLIADFDHSEMTRDIFARFFQVHLIWTTPFFDAIQMRAQTDFYRGLAQISQKLVNIIDPNA